MRLPSDERMSTLLTPTGLAIEGGVQGAVTDALRLPVPDAARRVRDVTGTTAQPAPVEGEPSSRSRFTPRCRPICRRPATASGSTSACMVGTRVYNFNGFTVRRAAVLEQAGTTLVLLLAGHPGERHARAGPPGRRVADPAALPVAAPRELQLQRLPRRRRRRGRRPLRDVGPQPHPRRRDPADVRRRRQPRLSYSLEPQFPADTIDARAEHRVELASGRADRADHRAGRHGRRTSARRGLRGEVGQRTDHEGRALHGLEAAALRPVHRDGHRLDPGPGRATLRGRRHLPLLDRQADDAGDGHVPGHAVPGRHQLRARHPVQPGGARRTSR